MGPDKIRLEVLRQQMTSATDELVHAFNKRGEIALAIAKEKQRLGCQQIVDPAREQLVIEQAQAVSTGPFSNEAVDRLTRLVIDESSILQAEAVGLPLVEERIVPDQ